MQITCTGNFGNVKVIDSSSIVDVDVSSSSSSSSSSLLCPMLLSFNSLVNSSCKLVNILELVLLVIFLERVSSSSSCEFVKSLSFVCDDLDEHVESERNVSDLF